MDQSDKKFVLRAVVIVISIIVVLVFKQAYDEWRARKLMREGMEQVQEQMRNLYPFRK